MTKQNNKPSVVMNSLATPLDFEIEGEKHRIPAGESSMVVTAKLREALKPFGDRVRVFAA